MPALIILLIGIAALVLLDVAAARWGVDSRIESTDPRSPVHPVGIK